MLELVGSDRRVLVLGRGNDDFAEALRQCEVMAVDPTAPGSFDGLEGRFDAVVFDGMLERLVDPLLALQKARSLLRPGGCVVSSVANVAHGAVRLALLCGRFDPGCAGLFTRESLEALLKQAGFTAVAVERTTVGVFELPEIPLDPDDFPTELVRSVQDAAEATTCRFVVRAVPTGEVGEGGPDQDPWGDSGPTPLEHDAWLERPRLASSLIRSIAALDMLLPRPTGNAASGSTGYVYGPDAAQDRDGYRAWLDVRSAWRRREREDTRQRLAALRRVPTISVLVPLHHPDAGLLDRCVSSVLEQESVGLELCLCQAGQDRDLQALLEKAAALDDRVLVTATETNGGSSAATNRAASSAKGDFLAFLGQHDELDPGALADVALALAQDGDVDVLYTDEDRIEADGARCEPFFKPDWSPDQLLSHMYVGRLLVVRRSLFEEVGGLRPQFEGSADYDLVLRITERARTVAHLPLVAYHRREVPEAPEPVTNAGARAALEGAMARRQQKAGVEPGRLQGTFRVRWAVSGTPLVSVIVPFHDGAELLRRCVTSLQETAGHEHWEAVLVDNRSWEPETRAVLARLSRDARCRVLPYPGEFNWAAINNHAVRHTSGQHILFLNADVEGRAQGWLTAMLEHSQRPEIGAVGARLLYPDGRVQHGGVVMGLGGGIAWHAFCFCPGDYPGYFGQAEVVRNYSAVTGACMMVRREVFESIGRFDEDLPVAYNDVDFCLRLKERGYRVVYTPFAELVHDESAWRGHISPDRRATQAMEERWGDVIRRDPYFNPNLDRRRTECALGAGWEVACERFSC